MTATLAPTLIRQDGRDKVTGSGRYAADLTVTGMLYGAFRIAAVSHARIRRIDATAASALPGVHAVMTAADVPDVRYGAYVRDRTLFARDVVRWEGELIAAVAATTPEIAARAAAMIDIDLEPLPAMTDLEAASSANAALVHADWATYDSESDLVRDGNVASRSTIVKGDAAAGMAERGHRRQGPLRRRRLACRPDRAASDPRRVAGRPRHHLVVDPGPIRRPSWCRGDPRPAAEPGSASSCPTSVEASAPSARSASSRRSRPWHGRPAGPSRSSSHDARNSCSPTTAENG